MARWQDELPDELKVNATLANYETPEDAFKAFVETKAKLGRSITIPSEDGGETARKEFIEKLQKNAPELIVKPTDENEDDFWKLAGVPEKPDDYSPPEDVGLSQDEITKYREYAQKVGMTQKQFEKGLVALNEQVVAQQEAAAELAQRDKQVLDSKWGLAIEQQDKIVNALVEKFQDPDNPVQGELNAAGKLMLANIAKAFKQSPQAFTQPAGTDGGITPDEAREEAGKIRARLLEEGRTLPPQERQRLNQKLVDLTRAAGAR